MSGAPHVSAVGNQLTSSPQENAKTRVNPSSIRESLKNAPAEEWLDLGVVAGGNTHVYARGIEDPVTHIKLRIGNPNATGQTINGRLLQQ